MSVKEISTADSCYFCIDFSQPDKDIFFLARFPELRRQTRLLEKTADMWLFPDMSPVVNNHLLISPIGHYTSFAVLPEGFGDQIDHLTKEVQNRFQSSEVFMFEHGMGILDQNVELCGNSVFHAHMHVIPVTDEKIVCIYDEAYQEARLLFDNKHRDFAITSDKEIPQLLATNTEGRPYLFIRRGEKGCVFIEDSDLKIPSQFLRRVAAEAVYGKDSFWNRKSEAPKDLQVATERVRKTYQFWEESERKAKEAVYDFSDINMATLKDALKRFEGYHKLESILLLKASGLPVSGGLVVSYFDDNIHEQLKKEYPGQVFGIRTDRKSEKVSLPRGGYGVHVDKLDEYLPNIVKEGRVAILVKPSGNDQMTRYDHSYSINLHFRGDELYVEVVGKGFDTSDLNRGDISPHQTFLFPKNEDLGNMTPWSIYENQQWVCNEERYRESVAQRLKKIGLGLTEGKERKLGDEEAIQLGQKRLAEMGKTTLLDDNQRYVPIAYEKLHKILHEVSYLPAQLAFVGEKSNNFVVGCSIFIDGKIKYWDIVFPQKKFKL